MRFLKSIREALASSSLPKPDPISDEDRSAQFDALLKKAWHGKNWEPVGDTLKLEGFPIIIRRATAEEMNKTNDINHFCVECDTLCPEFFDTLELAKARGEERAREIDRLPLRKG